MPWRRLPVYLPGVFTKIKKDSGQFYIEDGLGTRETLYPSRRLLADLTEYPRYGT